MEDEQKGAETYGLGRVAAAVGVEGQVGVAGKVDKVQHGVGHGVLLQVLGVLERVGQGSAPVAVCGGSASGVWSR